MSILCDLLQIAPGVTALIGGGGKTTLLRALAEELSQRARVIVATSTKMLVPDWCPVVLEASAASVTATLEQSPCVCVGSLHAETGKLDAPCLGFSELARLAKYVLVEADGSRGLPLKAHEGHEPVIPACASRTVCVVGADGIGDVISQVCHRPKVFAQLAGVPAQGAATPEAISAVLASEHLHDVLYINKVEHPSQWADAERIASYSATPVVAGSLWKGEFRCLR